MLMQKSIKQFGAGLLLGLAALHGSNASSATPDPSIPYYSWYEVTLPESSGASCGNGTPLRFYINRAQSDNILVGFEGGGACWNYGTCSGDAEGAEKLLGASNPDGIASNYMNATWIKSLTYTFMSPLMTRIDWQTFFIEPRVETQNWTQVFLPYCSGDISTGSAVQDYTGPNGNWRLQHFSGLQNTRAVMQWLVAHGFGQPRRLLTWGLSAGGYGSLVTYPIVRDTLAPQERSSLLDDAGTVFVTPFDADPATHPSVRIINTIKEQWGWSSADGLLGTMRDALGDSFDTNNIGSYYRALSDRYPHDRLGFTTFQQDKVIAAFYYVLFDPTVQALPDVPSKIAASLALFNKELPRLKTALGGLPNFGYYIPWARGNFISNHTVTSVTFDGTAIHENGINANVGDFVNNLLNQQEPLDTPVMKAFRTDQSDDFSLTFVAGWLLSLFNVFPY